MMPIDPSIYGQVGKIDAPTNPLDSLARQYQLQGMQMQAMQANQAYQDDQSMRQLARQYGSDPNALYQQMMRVNPKAAFALQQQMLGNQKTGAEITHLGAQADNQAALAKKNLTENDALKIAQHTAQLGPINTPEQFAQWAQDGANSGVLTPTQAQNYVLAAQQAQDPQAFASLKNKTAMGIGEYVKANAPHLTTMNLGGTESLVATPGLGGPAQTLFSAPKTQTPDSLASNQVQMRGQNMQAQTAREGHANQFLLAGMNPDGTYRNTVGPDGTIDLSKVAPEDMAAAYRYKTDGTLPPNMGRGAQGAAESRKIRAIATALDTTAGESPEDARIRQLALKGDVSAINTMRKREVAIGANVKNFDFNADQVLQLSSKVDRSGVPIINAWINAGRRSVTGNPDLAAFDTAIKTTVNEFAQIVSGTTSGATTEGEKQKAEKLLNAQQTPEQILAVVNQMRVESQNRMKSFNDQRGASMPTNVVKPKGTPAQPGATPSGTVIRYDSQGNRLQ